MTEVPKRLAPTPKTLQELFLKSGNLCAFPGCRAILMDADGTFIGQLCHIEAAEPGGERFNSAMSNEQRRAPSNLMLMCYPHHRITNDVTRYSAEELRSMKARHEARFSSPDRSLRELVSNAKWTSLVGAGAIAGAAVGDIVRAFKSLLDKAEPGSANEVQPPRRRELLRRLRLAPTGVVHYYTRDPLHAAVGDQFLEVFQDAGWVLEQLPQPRDERRRADTRHLDSMILFFEISDPQQVTNTRRAIVGFFEACGFSPATDDQPAEREEGGRPIRFAIVVGARARSGR